jgi:hypothetical protein
MAQTNKGSGVTRMAGALMFQAVQHPELDTLGLEATRDFLKKRARYLRLVAQKIKANGVNVTPGPSSIALLSICIYLTRRRSRLHGLCLTFKMSCTTCMAQKYLRRWIFVKAIGRYLCPKILKTVNLSSRRMECTHRPLWHG